MFGILPFGTIRFGEPQGAVSPVLLSVIGVQSAGVPVVQISVDRTIRTTGYTPTVNIVTPTIGRQLAATGTASGKNAATLRTWPTLVVRQIGADFAIAHILRTGLLASNSVGLSVSTTGFAPLTLSAWASQGLDSIVRPVIERRLPSDAPSVAGVAQTDLTITKVLASSGSSSEWTEASIRTPGLFILNLQSEYGITRPWAGRAIRICEQGGHSQGGITGLSLVRTLSSRSVETAVCHVSIEGVRLVVLEFQEGFVFGRLLASRFPAGHGVGSASTGIEMEIVRTLAADEFQPGSVLLSFSTLKDLCGNGVQTGTGHTAVDVIRTIGAYSQQDTLFYSRFGVLPDLRNDRLVVVFGEGRKTVIPRQSEL